MRILFVQKMNGISGSELYFLQILPELKKRGYDVEVLIIFPKQGTLNKRFVSFLSESQIKTHEIYGHFDLSPILFNKIIRLIKKEKYDLIQSNLVHADLWIALIRKFFFRKFKMISVKHGYNPSYQAKYGADTKYLKSDLFYWIERFASRVADFNITISKWIYNIYVTGNIVPQKKIKTIYYGLKLEAPVFEPEKALIPAGDFILITGRLVAFKGHKYLIDAWKKVTLQYPEVKLCIAGNGVLKEELEKQVSDTGLTGKVIFLGHVPNPHPVMEKCLFTIVSSIAEGFGLILLESWFHKKPIVAFDVPAMNEIIDDKKNGLLAKGLDSEDLSEKIIFLLKNRHLINEYGENGYHKLMSYYTLKRMTDETVLVYEAVYNNHPVTGV